MDFFIKCTTSIIQVCHSDLQGRFVGATIVKVHVGTALRILF